ncbi:hypothetical protein [Bacillus rhizoplanae]|uniref:hypothetical protein n=1 Tax=Bacillus rhizoplanae TaxID=2880966 RepID=UPI003D1B206A
MLNKLLTFTMVAGVILALLLALIIPIAKGEMVNTGVAANPSVWDVIKYIYHGLF